MKKKKQSFREKSDNKLGYRFLMPWLIGFLVFTIYPLFYTFFLSFNNVRQTALGWETQFTGLENYVTALLRNISFGPAIVSFFTIEMLYAPSIVIIALILSLLLNTNIKFRGGFRMIYFLPVIVLSSSVMQQLTESGGTEIQHFEEIFVFEMVASYSELFAELLYMLFQNFSMVLWFTGIPIILFINGLQKVDKAIYEAAEIDGATQWQILWKITIPVIKPIALVATIFTVVQIGTYPINPVYTMISEAIYNTSNGLGVASAYTYVYSLVVLLFIGVAFLLLRENKSEEYEVKRKG